MKNNIPLQLGTLLLGFEVNVLGLFGSVYPHKYNSIRCATVVQYEVLRWIYTQIIAQALKILAFCHMATELMLGLNE